MENSKYKNQIKHIKNNYKRFHIDFKIDDYNKLKTICSKNNTTITTEIKKFLNNFINNNSDLL